MVENKENKKDEGLIKDTFELVLKEFQIVITLFYLLLIGLGMMFNYYKYTAFGINIFQYSTVFDYLIAPFKEQVILKFAGYALLGVLFFHLSQMFAGFIRERVFKKKKKRNLTARIINNKRVENLIMAVMVVILFFLYFSFYAEDYCKEFKEEITNQSTISVELLTGEIEKGQLIGKTESYIFLYQNGVVNIMPVGTSVKKIVLR